MLNARANYSLPISEVEPIVPQHIRSQVRGWNGDAMPFMLVKHLINDYHRHDHLRPYLDAVIHNPNREDHVKSFMVPIFYNYFPLDDKFVPVTEKKTGIGQVDGLINIFSDHHTCCELKSQNGDSFSQMLIQARRYARYDIDTGRMFVIAIKGTYISFFIYQQDWHDDHHFKLKSKDTKGLLGLYVNKNGVDIIPQENTYAPQVMFYNYNSSKHQQNFSIHVLYRFLSMHAVAPSVYIDDSDKPRLSIKKQVEQLAPNWEKSSEVSSIKFKAGTTNLTVGLNLNKVGHFDWKV